MWIFRSVLKWFTAHLVDKIFISRENPPQKHQKKSKENDERYDRPDGDVINALKNILVHKINYLRSLFFQL